MLLVEPFAFFLGALLLVTLPLSWLLAAFFAALIHELCHMAALFILGLQVRGIRIGAAGAVIDTGPATPGKELMCTLAGPLGSFFLLSMHHVCPKLAICAGIQGLFNLLPIYPMDGGRILQCILELCRVPQPEKVRRILEKFLVTLFILLCTAGSLFFSLGLMPLIFTVLLILRLRTGKRPCKQRTNRVQ